MRCLGRRPDGTSGDSHIARWFMASSTAFCLFSHPRVATLGRPKPLLSLRFLPHVRGLFGVAGARCPSATPLCYCCRLVVLCFFRLLMIIWPLVLVSTVRCRGMV